MRLTRFFYCHLLFSLNSQNRPSARGQGGLIAVAIMIVIGLVLASTTITGLSQMNAKRTLSTRQTLQTYYVAQAGIQEAMATRMMPRSNYLNFLSPRPAGVSPYLNESGLVFQDPVNRRSLIGVYRYLVVGGDPSRDPTRSAGNPSLNYYGVPAGPPFAVGADTTQNAANPIPRLVTFKTAPAASPFYVISNGITCKGPDGSVGIDRFLNAPTTDPAVIGINPICKSGFQKDEVTLISRINLDSETTGSMDRLNQTQLVKNANNITLPAGAFIPGSGWGTTVNFSNAWAHATTASTPVRLTRIVFFKFGPNRIYSSVDLSASANRTVVPGRVPVDASMMLYFDGPIDYRSISNNLVAPANPAVYYDKDLAACKLSPPTVNNLNNCAIQIYRNPAGAGVGGTQETGLLVVPITPYLTKVLLLAPIGNSAVNNVNYEVRLRLDAIRSFSQAPGTGQYTVAFQTCPAAGGPAPCP